MQCGAQHQAERHHTESTDGAARHAGCSGPIRPCETAHRRRQGSVGHVRECTGPAMQQHTYTQRAHNTHSPARLPLPVGRHPGLCPLVTAPSAQHNTTQRNTPQHNTTQHNTTQHDTTQHNTTRHKTTQHNTTQGNTTQHNTTRHNTRQHNTTQGNMTQHNTTQGNTTQHNTTQPEYSPALPMSWVPGAKPRTTGPGHHPMGGVLTVSGVRTPQCQTPPPRSPRPPSTGLQGSGNGQ